MLRVPASLALFTIGVHFLTKWQDGIQIFTFSTSSHHLWIYFAAALFWVASVIAVKGTG